MKKLLVTIVVILIFSLIMIAQTFNYDQLSMKNRDRYSDHTEFCNRATETKAEKLKILPEQKLLLDSIRSSFWDITTNTWSDYQSFVNIYDFNGNKVEYYSTTTWNDVIWVYLGKEFYTNDSNGNIINTLWFDWDGETNEFVKHDSTVSTYDSIGNLTSSILSKWDLTTNTWISSSKSAYTYNNNGNITESAVYNWNNIGNWICYYKLTYKYNKEGSLIESHTYVGNENDNIWVFSSKTIYSNDSNGYAIESINYIPVNNDSSWVASSKNVMTNDEKGNTIERIRYTWDSIAKNWLYQYKNTFKYDENGNRIEVTDIIWDVKTNEWVFQRKRIENYDSNGNKENWIGYDWDIDSKNWIFRQKETYYYSIHELGTIIPTVNTVNNLTLYPNPVTNDELNIKLSSCLEEASVAIFNLDGKKLYIGNIEKLNNAINVGNLSPGVYIIQISKGSYLVSGKFIIR